MVELNEWLHEAYLNNNWDIHKLKIQNEQLLERLQDTCFSSYVSDCLMVDCLEDSHEYEIEDIHNTLKDINKNMSCMILSIVVWNKIEKLWNGWFDK